MSWASSENILSSHFIGAKKKSHSINAVVESGASSGNLILTKECSTIQGTQYSFLALKEEQNIYLVLSSCLED